MTVIAILLWATAVLLVVAGIVGAVVPGLPGPPLAGAGLVLAAWADGFERVGAGTVAVLVGLAALSYGIDFLATAMGAQRFGASRRAMVGASIGAIVGIFFGLAGIVLGPFIGAVAGELSIEGNFARASQAGMGAWLGLLMGSAAKIALVFTMIGVFTLSYLV